MLPLSLSGNSGVSGSAVPTVETLGHAGGFSAHTVFTRLARHQASCLPWVDSDALRQDDLSVLERRRTQATRHDQAVLRDFDLCRKPRRSLSGVGAEIFSPPPLYAAAEVSIPKTMTASGVVKYLDIAVDRSRTSP